MLAPAARAVRLRHHGLNPVAPFHQPNERGNGEFGRAQVNQAHGPQAQSPARCRFLILRLIRSRLSALIWVM